MANRAKKAIKNVRTRKPRRRNRGGAGSNEALERIMGHTNMVMDPCNSKICPTAYRGSDGFVQRFRTTQSLVLTTQSCFLSVYYPAYNSFYLAAIPLPASGIAGPITYNIAGPGQAFLLANADSQRAVAACTQVNYTGTELDRQGLLYRGVVKASVFSNSFTLDQITALLGNPERVPDHTSEVKWIPGACEEEYWNTGAVTPDAPGDRNVIVNVGIGFTSSVTFTFTNTLIAEWQPNFGVGIAANTQNTADAPAGFEHVKTQLAKAGNWWVSAAHSLETGYQTAAKVYRATKGIRAGMSALALTM